uniref:Pepsin-I3 domain-containing protein n=1 Tax=Steinernema glaseri TaxID=37863 RepID=A0A1I7YUC7_9BILA
MKCAVLLCLAAVAVAGPVKRFAGFGALSGLSTIGGNLGCVVTGNKLFVNGLYTKELSVAEQQEFETYEQQIKDFKQRVKEVLEEKRKNAGKAVATAAEKTVKKSDLPEPPAKPSFCSEKDTTQYIFDGCKVQHNKVYIGNTYARDLSSDEVTQLKEFDEKMTQYQKYLNSNIQSQVEELFGKHFSGLFNRANVRKHSRDESTTPAPDSTTEAPQEAPVAPNFCTTIF